MNRKLNTLVTVGIVVVFIALTFTSALRESLTFDEIFNLQEGRTNILTQTFPIEPYNPPLIRELASFPYFLGFELRTPQSNLAALPSRGIIMLLGVILLLSVMRTANFYFGQQSSWLAGLLFALEPALLSHAHYITPDIGLTLFTFVSYIAFLRLLSSPTTLRFFYFGILFGLAAASKISALPFLVGSIIGVFVITRKRYPLSWYWDHSGKALLSVVVASFVVWSTFFFRSSPILIKHDDPLRVSNQLLRFAQKQHLSFITQQIEWLQGTPIPLGDYLALVKNNMLRFKTTSPVFFQGAFFPSVGSHMILLTLLLKLSLPLSILVIIGGIHQLVPDTIKKYFSQKIPLLSVRESTDKKENVLVKEEKKVTQGVPGYKIRLPLQINDQFTHPIFFFIPVVVILSFAMISRMQPLVRYVLPLFPFLVILAGASAPFFITWKKRLMLFILILWVGVGTVGNFPHFIGFTNELVIEEKRYQWFIDSNLDWGQGLITFAEYYRERKPNRLLFSYFGRDNADTYGLVSDLPWGSHKNDEICAFHQITNTNFSEKTMTAISVTNWYLCGFYKDPVYARENIEDIVGDSILIFSSAHQQT